MRKYLLLAFLLSLLVVSPVHAWFTGFGGGSGGGSFDPASPGDIGGTTPGAGTFTTLKAASIQTTAADGDRYWSFLNNTSVTPGSGTNRLYFVGNVFKAEMNGVAYTVQKQVARRLATFNWDGGGSALSAAATTKRCIIIPAASTLTGLYASTQAESTSDVTIALYKDAFAAGAHATTAMISGTNAVVIPAAGTVLNVHDTTLTGFTKTIAAGDQICAEITATDTTTWLQLSLYGTD